MSTEIILFSIVSTGFIAAVAIKSKKWSVALQRLYVRAARRQDGYYPDFGKPWIRMLMQSGIIFSSVVIVLWVFVLSFGTLYATHTATGQTRWVLQH